MSPYFDFKKDSMVLIFNVEKATKAQNDRHKEPQKHRH